MSEIRIKGNTQIRPATVTQDRHKPYLGHTMEVLQQFVVGTHPGTTNPLVSPRYGEVVLCTSNGTWNGDAVLADHFYQWQEPGWEDVGTRVDGTRVVAGFGGGTLMNNLIGDFVGHENELAIWDDGNSAWVWIEPEDSTSWLCYVRGGGFWNQMTFMWAYVDGIAAWAWTPVTRWMDKAAGHGLKAVGPGGLLSTTDSDDNKLAIELETDEVDLVVDNDGLYHDTKLAHVVRVQISQFKDDSLSQPDGNEAEGDVYHITGTPAGAWGTFSTGDIVQYQNSAWVKLTDTANLVSGMNARIAASPGAGATFAGEGNKITTWNGSDWTGNNSDYYDPRDGVICIQDQLSAATQYRDVYVWNDIDGSWVEIGSSISVSGNALQESSGVISHVDEAGHSFEAVRFLVYSDIDQSESDPLATAYPNQAIIANNCDTFVDGAVYWSNGQTWTLLTTVNLTTGSRIVTGASVEGGCGLTANMIHENTNGTFGTANDWTTTTPHEGDIVHVRQPDQNHDEYPYSRFTAMWRGSEWLPMSKYVSNMVGSGLTSNTLNQLEVLLKSDAGLTVDSNGLIVYGESDSGPAEATGSDRPALVSYVDAVAQGLHPKSPVAVLKMVDDSLVTAPTLTLNEAGNAYVVAGTGGGWSGFAVGDIVEWSGTAWTRIVQQSGGEPPDGTRVIVTTGTAAGSFAGEEGEIATYDASGDSWSFYDPEDGDFLFVNGEDSIYENNQYVCDTDGGTTIKWIQIGGVGAYTGSTGIDITGAAISIDTDRASGTPASGTTWSSGVTGLDPTNMLCILNGLVMEYESVIGNLEAGEFNYNAGTGDVTVSAADSFDGQDDFIAIWGFKS